MGYVAVATLIASGLVNTWFLVGSVSNLLTTVYGRMLITKLLLFGGMLALAAINRFWLVPSMIKARAEDLNDCAFWTGRLRAHVLSEQLLGLAVLLIVSVLGPSDPQSVNDTFLLRWSQLGAGHVASDFPVIDVDIAAAVRNK